MESSKPTVGDGGRWRDSNYYKSKDIDSQGMWVSSKTTKESPTKKPPKFSYRLAEELKTFYNSWGIPST